MPAEDAQNTQRQPMDMFNIRKVLNQWALVHRIERPKVQYSSTKECVELKFVGGSWVPIPIVALFLASLFVPYFIVVVTGSLHPFLPLVSQIGGSPPQSGVFSLLLTVSSSVGFLAHLALFMVLQMRQRQLEDDWVRQTVSLLLKISLIPSHVGMFGVLIVSAFPLDLNRKTEQWKAFTVAPHLFGSLCTFLGGLFYCILLTYILALIHPQKKRILGIRVFLLSLITMLSALQGYTVCDGFTFPDKEAVITSCAIEADDIPYNLSYLISAVCEWCLVLAFFVFFLTLKEEGEDICLAITVTPRVQEVSEKKLSESDSNSEKSQPPVNEEAVAAQ